MVVQAWSNTLAGVWVLAMAVANDGRADTCSLQWSPQFAGGAVQGIVYAMAEFDDGNGPGVFVAGDIAKVGGIAVNHIARWNGMTWEAVGSGVNLPVRALAVYDDGSGPALYAAGQFTIAGGFIVNGIARWNGQAWSGLGTGIGGIGYALEVFDSGGGPELYVGGSFNLVAGQLSRGIARWDGKAWHAMLGGVFGLSGSNVYALSTFNDGTGEALYAGGQFTSAGGQSALNITRWNGTSFSALTSGTGAPVFALQSFTDTGGAALYVGGTFTSAGGVSAQRIARWSGSAWSALGTGMALGVPGDPQVSSLVVLDDGTGPALFVGGRFNFAGSLPAKNVARWSGTAWSGLGDGLEGFDSAVYALGVITGQTGPHLLAGGLFTLSGQFTVKSLSFWSGATWAPLGQGMDDVVYALTIYDDGINGPALYAAGDFRLAGATQANRIARWDGSGWSPLGAGVDGGINALAEFEGSLYAGGHFQTAGGVSSPNIAKWNGEEWIAVGSGVTGQVRSLAVHDDGSGPALYVGGAFSVIGQPGIEGVARWNGASWSQVGIAFGGDGGMTWTLASINDGSGMALYAGGSFLYAGITTLNYLARWNGVSWTALGSGADDWVFALRGADLGPGTSIYVGGDFTTIGGESYPGIAQWDVDSWSPLNKGLNGDVHALAAFTTANGPSVVAGGTFTDAGGIPGTLGIAVWNGTTWSTAAGGFPTSGSTTVYAMQPADEGGVAALYVAGGFESAGGLSAGNIARLECIAPPTAPEDINGDGQVDGFDLALLLGAWGRCPAKGAPGSCPADLDGSGIVDGIDLAILLAAWG